MITPFSVITVCYNEEAGIPRTIESIEKQTLQNFEWIVVDGGSVDRTLEFIRNSQRKPDILVSEKDGGIYQAMNKGIGMAHGEYLIFLNGGDYFFNEDTLQSVMERGLNSDIAYGDIMVFDEKMQPALLEMPEQLTPEFHFHKTLPHQSTFIRRKLFEKIGSYDESLRIVADYDFTIKAMTRYQIEFQHIGIPVAWFFPLGVSNDNQRREKEKSLVHKRYFSKLERLIYRNRLQSRYYIARNHLGNHLLRRRTK